MKKLLLFTAITALALSAAQSQELRFGIKAGLNVATIGGDDYYDDLDPRLSFHIGGLVEIPLARRFSLQPEILYSSQGAKYDDDFDIFDDTVEGDLILDYITVPILVKFSIIEGLSAEAGPVFSFLVSAEEDHFNNDGEVERFDAENDYKSFDAALAVGASYRLNMGVFFSLRYNKGFLDINDSEMIILKNQNNVLQASAGYSF